MLRKTHSPRQFYQSLYIGILLIFLSACRKEAIIFPVDVNSNQSAAVCYDCDFLQQNYLDSNDHPTILGEEINNPYLLPVMKAAYRNVYGKDPGRLIKVTHNYIKFSPKNYRELSRLEEEDIELFDYPLHRALVSEGDYYIQPGKQVEDIPDYYSVVDVSYKMPGGISSVILNELFIPDNDPLLENEALRLTGNLNDGAEYVKDYTGSRELKNLYPDPGDGGANDVPGFSENNSCGHYPSGKIAVQNELLTDRGYRPVTNVKVVIRRLFKVETAYTDANGAFRSEKYFRNKYTILVKFKNSLSRIARMRPWALHEQFFPIKINFGKWDKLDCGHEFRISHPAQTGKISTSHWCAAVTHNGIQEHRSMSSAENIAVPPGGLNIMLSQKQGSGNGNTYMLNKILVSDPLVIGIEVVITDVILFWSPAGAAISLVAMEAFKARSPDIKYGYGGDPDYLTTDRYCELVYHELSHASHYQVVGNDWWIAFGLAESKNDGPGFYGDCCTKYAPRIALAEGWSYFIGHYMADKKWGLQSTRFPEQGNLQSYENLLYFVTANEISSHIHFVESYDPHRTIDYSYWVPKGLFYDLYDPAVELFPENMIQDNVSGLSCRQLFEAMEKDIEGIDTYRNRLIEKNGLKNKESVIDLFRQYGY